MAGAAVLAIRVALDATKAIAELKSTGKETTKWAGGLNKASALAGAGLGALAGYATLAVKAAAEDAQGQATLAKTLQNSAHATDAAIASTEDWIAKTSLASGVADDELRPALGALVRATGDTATAQAALTTAMDISAATGKDVSSVSAALAKGYAGSTKGLAKLGLGIDATTLKSGDMVAIMAEVNKTVGGASATAANTAAGKWQRMQVAMAETQETLGAVLLPALSELLGILQPILAALSQNTTLVVVLVSVLGALAVAVIAVSAVTKVAGAVTKIWSTAQKAATIATRLWTIAQWQLAAAMDANPIGVIVIAVIALVAVFVLAYKKVGWFRRGVDAALHGVLAVVTATFSWIKQHWPLLLAILTGPIGVAVLLIVKNLGTIKRVFRSVFSAVGDFIQPVIDLFSTLLDWVKRVIDLIGKIKIPKLPKLDLNPFSAPAPAYAYAPTVSGLSRSAVPMASSTSSGRTQVVNIYGALDPQQTARIVQRLQHTADVRAGRKRFA